MNKENGQGGWDKFYAALSDSYLFPNEYVVRSFLGNYPGLSIDRNYRGAKICDISCGDGRNLTALHKIRFDLYGTEISQTICDITKRKLLAHAEHIDADIRPGVNSALPFEDGFFDYLLSWNACYYMETPQSDISTHVAEYARVARKGAYMVVSVPTPKCFSLEGAEELGNNLIRLHSVKKFDVLNGAIYHRFDSRADIEAIFGTHFENFSHCTITDDCFGLPLEYFIFVCQKR